MGVIKFSDKRPKKIIKVVIIYNREEYSYTARYGKSGLYEKETNVRGALPRDVVLDEILGSKSITPRGVFPKKVQYIVRVVPRLR